MFISSKAAELNALGSTTTVDFYRHIIRKEATDAHYVTASRWFTFLWGLIALAFAPEDFYEPQQINLGILPAYEVQRPYLSEFRKRVLVVMQQHSMRIFEAEQLVWQQIEAELLQSLLVNNQQEVP